MNSLPKFDSRWTLFLDRDGVINEEKSNDYIYHFGEFRFLPGVTEALKILAAIFPRILLVTNQRGVGRGLMTEEHLLNLHRQMMVEIENSGGRIDRIYYCTATENSDPCRKPNPGMAQLARQDFPGIDFQQSIMIGNNLSDMIFGKNAGMLTAHVYTTLPPFPLPDPRIDYSFADLLEFAQAATNSSL